MSEFEGYIINDPCGGDVAFGWFDNVHCEPTEMTREELENFIIFLQQMLNENPK